MSRKFVIFISFFLLLNTFANENFYQEGEAYFQAKQYQKAINAFTKVLSEPKSNDYFAIASLRLGQCYLLTGDLKNARKYFVIASWQGGEISSQGRLGIAICDIQEGNYEDSIKSLTSLINQKPERKTLAYAYYNRGIAFEKKGWLTAAINDFQESITLGYDDNNLLSAAKAHLSTCQSAYVRFVEEEQTYLQRMKQSNSPDEVRDLYHELAKICADVGEIEKAIDYEKKSLTYSNDENYSSGALMNIAWRYAMIGDYEKAAETFQKVFQEYPTSQYAPEALLNAADMLSVAKKTDEAINLYNEFIKNYPNDKKIAFAMMSIAWRYAEKGGEEDLEKSAEMFLKIAEQFPDSDYAPEALLRAGDMYARIGENSYAIDAYQRFIDKYPNDPRLPTVMLNLAWRLALLKDAREEMEEILLEIHKRFPNTELGWFALGLYYEKLGENEKALDCYRKASEFYGPQRAISLLNMIGRYHDLGNYELAIKTFQQFWKEFEINAVPDPLIIAEATVYAARCFEHLLDYHSAIKTYNLLIRCLGGSFQKSAPPPGLTPWLINAKIRIGYCYLQIGKVEKALASWKEVTGIEAQSILNSYENVIKPSTPLLPLPKKGCIKFIGPIGGVLLDFKTDLRKEKVLCIFSTQGANKEENIASAEVARDFYKFPFQLKKDIEVSPEELKENNLVIFGTPKSNRVFALLKDKLPVKIEDGTIEVGNRIYKGKDIGIIMIAPNPFNTEKFVLIFCAFAPSLLRNVYEILPRDYVDYFIFTEKMVGHPDVAPPEEGYFLKLSPDKWVAL